jgi:aminopeptidase N
VLATTDVRSGQMLSRATQVFYPRWSDTQETVARAHALLARDDMDTTIRRELVDETWDLERRLAIRQAFGGRA